LKAFDLSGLSLAKEKLHGTPEYALQVVCGKEKARKLCYES